MNESARMVSASVKITIPTRTKPPSEEGLRGGRGVGVMAASSVVEKHGAGELDALAVGSADLKLGELDQGVRAAKAERLDLGASDRAEVRAASDLLVDQRVGRVPPQAEEFRPGRVPHRDPLVQAVGRIEDRHRGRTVQAVAQGAEDHA